MKTDITEYSDRELSLIVFNTEYLYQIRHRYDFIEMIKDLFTYRPEQLEELLTDLEEDLEEIEKCAALINYKRKKE